MNEEMDKLRTKVCKYVLYKKRTEKEVQQKFAEVPQDMLEEILEDLKESGYISDTDYIEKAVDEFMRLKSLSIRELRYKLIAKGLGKNLIEEYFDKNWDALREYEKASAEKLIQKKSKSKSLEEIKKYLMTKGYSTDIINLY